MIFAAERWITFHGLKQEAVLALAVLMAGGESSNAVHFCPLSLGTTGQFTPQNHSTASKEKGAWAYTSRGRAHQASQSAGAGLALGSLGVAATTRSWPSKGPRRHSGTPVCSGNGLQSDLISQGLHSKSPAPGSCCLSLALRCVAFALSLLFPSLSLIPSSALLSSPLLSSPPSLPPPSLLAPSNIHPPPLLHHQSSIPPLYIPFDDSRPLLINSSLLSPPSSACTTFIP